MIADSDIDREAADEVDAGYGWLLPPRANPDLLGHEHAETQLLGAWQSGRLPHAWLIGGPRGIGKATLAFRFARFVLSEGEAGGGGLFAAAPPASLAVAPTSPVFRRVASGGHADLLTIERSVNPRTGRLRDEIVVEETRAIPGFLHLTPAEGGWRIVIIDGGEALNTSAANALLKILEEPPRRALLMIVAHQPERLLPTIRSRCRRLLLEPLTDGSVETLIARYRPDLPADERSALAGLAAGSIGRALELAAVGGVALRRELMRLLAGLPQVDVGAVHALADRLAGRGSEVAYRTLTELLVDMLAGLARQRGLGTVPRDPEEAAVQQALARRLDLDQWVEVWEKIGRLFACAESVNLDRKQVLLNAFHMLEAATR